MNANTNLNPFSKPQRELKVDLDKFAAALEKQRRQAIQAGVEKELARRRCKSCKHWERWVRVNNKPVCGRCRSPKLSAGPSANFPCPTGDGVAVEDAMFTGPDFGCIHFKERV